MKNTIIKLINDSNIKQKHQRFEVPFIDVANIYYFTNENLKDSFDKLNFNQTKRVLSVCGSGDQVLNLVHKGVKEIDVFDSNELAVYFLKAFKIPALKSFNYQDYKTFFKKMIDDDITVLEQKQLFCILKDHMDRKYFDFFIEIFNNSIQNNHNLSIMKILCINTDNIDNIELFNGYYETENDYLITKDNINFVNINFVKTDIFDINKNFNGNYDKMFFSNIFDYLYKKIGEYWTYEELKPYINNLFLPMLSNDGELIISYMFKHYSFTRCTSRTNVYPSSKLSKDDTNWEFINFPALINKNGRYEKSNSVGDSIAIARK